MAYVGSVQVGILDDEHEECVNAYNELLRTRSLAAVDNLHAILQKHFQHEEDLLEIHLYAELPSAFGGFSADASARSSHFADHARMLTYLSDARTRGWSEVPLSFIKEVMLDFERHASTYDNNYAERLSSVLG